MAHVQPVSISTRPKRTRLPTEDQLKELARQHAKSGEGDLLFAARYRLGDKRNVYLLEVAEYASDPGDGSWDTFEFLTPREWRLPSVSRLKITYLSPEEFNFAIDHKETRGHKIYSEIRRDGFKTLFVRPRRGRKFEVKLERGETASRSRRLD